MTPAISTQTGQSVRHVLLVRPARFGYNPQTAASNRFQQPEIEHQDVAARAAAEFERLCSALRAAGVQLCVEEDSLEPAKPDALFPNNWVSWHHDGTTVLYPLQAANRRPERRRELLEAAEACAGFRRRRLVDLSAYEQQGRYLEGTGSLVLDHLRRVGYACRSSRTDESLVQRWAELLDYRPVVFDAAGPDGAPIYHTNVLLAIGTTWAVVCTQAIAAQDRERVLAELRASGRELIELGVPALRAFAGNVLELMGTRAPENPRTLVVMSVAAQRALAVQGTDLQRLADRVDAVVAVDVSTIEAAGGGSVRCMLAEIPVAA